FPFGGSCFSSVAQPANSKRDEEYRYEAQGTAGLGVTIDTRHALDSPAYVAYEHTASKSRPRGVQIPISEATSSTAATGLHKRGGGVPYLPGNLFCPAVGSEILNTPSGSRTCQIYATLSSNTGQTADALNRRDEDIEALEFSTFNRSSEGFHPKILAESTLKVCPGFTIPIADYSKVQVQTYFDLANPGDLDPTYSRSKLPSYLRCTQINTGTTKGGAPALSQANSAAIYAREHVYEQSMSALFVDYLAQFPDLWQNAAKKQQFCNWVSENLIAATTYYPGVEVFPNPTVFGDIGQCYPGGTSGGNAMVILEQQSNTFKNTLLYYQEAKLNNLGSQVLMDGKEFSNYCSTTQVAKLRAAAAVPSYMNDYTVSPNRANINVPDLYDNWISTVVNGMVPFLRSEITRLIPLYNGGETTATDIDLSYAILLDNANILNRNGQPMDTGTAPFTVDRPVTRQDLINNILNQIPDISWASTLPRH
ncbi:hypothetical protein H0H93_006247, partial [Arthromyces matolae]